MKKPSPQKLREWKKRAALKEAIVPHYFEVFPNKVHLTCGNCRHEFRRNLVPNVNEPTFICPIKGCQSRNWIPVRFQL